MAEYPDASRQKQLQRCLLKLGLANTATVNWQLLDQALTHSSIAATENYEFLEFLGDSVLRLAAAEFLMDHYSTLSLGEMAAVRSHLVSDQLLATLADELGLETYLRQSASAFHDRAGRRSRLADAFEAVLGALYLSTHDQSLIRPWLDGHFSRLTQTIRQDPTLRNYKAALQELTQAHTKSLPQYQTQEISLTHSHPERFRAQVWFQGRMWGEGTGPSIKQAEQAAAQIAYAALQAHFTTPTAPPEVASSEAAL